MEEQISVRVLVDEKKNRVVYVQAGKDFVDVLLSFLTLPLGTIARLVGKESNMNKVSFGSLSSLYESVANLEVKHFWTDACKEMLIQPRNPMESYCQNLKLNIDDTENIKYFICEDLLCIRRRAGGFLSTFRNQRCKCGKFMNRVIDNYSPSPIRHVGFVSEMATFIISDDLKVTPDNFQISCLPINVEYEDFEAIKLLTVHVTQTEIMDILKCSLLSKTPLTDVLLMKKQVIENAQPGTTLDFNTVELEANGGVHQMIKIKVLLRKSNKSILFALAEEDFVDIILSFLTFPLGGVEHMLNGNSCLGSIDNLYNSIVHMDCNKYLGSPDLKGKLLKSPLAHQFKIQNQILSIDEGPTSNCSCYCKYDTKGNVNRTYLTALQDYRTTYSEFTGMNEVYAPLSYLEPQSTTGEVYSKNGGRGFVKKLSMFMVWLSYQVLQFLLLPFSKN